MIRRILGFIGSVRLALVGMAMLGVGAGLSYGNPETTSVWVLVVPLALMAVNLLTAILINPRIHRRGPLLAFHIGLLAMVVLAALGRLTFFDARVEMLEGSAFDPANLINVKRGVWHDDTLKHIEFVQGHYTIDYSPGMIRGLTHSHVRVPTAGHEWEEKVVGDDRPLVVDGYRFYTTFNKGYATLLTWIPDGGSPITGAIHMPSYPLFEHKQDNTWQPPGAVDIRFWLRLDTGLDESKSWVLNGQPVTSTLVVNAGAQRVELAPGDGVRLEGGTLRYERLLTWMGYKIFYDPTLHWMFIASMLSVIGLSIHFWQKFGLKFIPEQVVQGEVKQPIDAGQLIRSRHPAGVVGESQGKTKDFERKQGV